MKRKTIKQHIPLQYSLTGAVRHLVDVRRINCIDYKVYDEWQSLGKPEHNVLTATGEAEYHDRQFINVTTGFNWIGLTESVLTPARTDTALTGEMTVSGFARAQATTRTYAAGTSTSTLSKTFTASGSITSILGSGLFNVAGPPVIGIMAHVANFTTGSGLLVSGDQLAVTWAATEGP